MQFAIVIRKSAGFTEVLGTEFDSGLTDDMTFTPQPTITRTDKFEQLRYVCGYRELT